eukprot:6159599-Prymnesium_polylepis.2
MQRGARAARRTCSAARVQRGLCDAACATRRVQRGVSRAVPEWAASACRRRAACLTAPRASLHRPRRVPHRRHARRVPHRRHTRVPHRRHAR